jgi:hypothetical protein
MVKRLTLWCTAMTKMHSKERVMAARVSRRNPTHRLHARKAYHQELLRSRAVTNSPLKWSATSYALMVGKPCSSSLYQNRCSLRTCFQQHD